MIGLMLGNNFTFNYDVFTKDIQWVSVPIVSQLDIRMSFRQLFKSGILYRDSFSSSYKYRTNFTRRNWE